MRQGIIVGLDAIPNNTRTAETTLIKVECADGVMRYIPNLAFEPSNPNDTGLLHLLNKGGVDKFSDLIGRSILYKTMDRDDEIIQGFQLTKEESL